MDDYILSRELKRLLRKDLVRCNNDIYYKIIIDENKYKLIVLNDDSLEYHSNKIKLDLFIHQRKVIKFIFDNENKIINNYVRFMINIKNIIDFNIFLYNNFNYLNDYNIKLDVGSGKSYIGLCSIILNPIFNYENIKINNHIIVTSFKLINQWENYIKNLNILKHTYKINKTKYVKDIHIYMNDNNKYRIFLVSDSMLKIHGNFLKAYKFNKCIVDEYFMIQKIYNKYISNLDIMFTYKLCASTDIKTNHTIMVDKIYLKLPEINHRIIEIENIILNNDKMFCLTDNIKRDIELDKFENINDLLKSIFDEWMCEKNRIKDIIKNRSKDDVIEELNKKYESIKIKMENFKKRLLDPECIICYTDIIDKVILFCCTQCVCSKCFTKIDKCPMCRYIIDKEVITDSMIMSKKINVLSKLKFTSNPKIIIVGNSNCFNENNLKEISNKLFFNDNSYKYYSGNSATCQNILNKFKNNEFNILCFKNLSMVCGLNLEYVTDLIILDKQDEKLKNQIIGRVQRFGRKSILNIYELLYI